MANDTKKAKPNSAPRKAPEKPVQASDEDDALLLAGGAAVLRAIFRPRPPRRRGGRS